MVLIDKFRISLVFFKHSDTKEVLLVLCQTRIGRTQINIEDR